MARKLEQFDSWLSEIKKPKWNHREVCIAEDAWVAALEMVSKLCPTNKNATFANQGQGMDGYTELANYKAMYEKLKEELNGN